jgi:ABC-type uncharacterized transport system substrate-binding protein
MPRRLAAIMLCLAGSIGIAEAHPHVWVDARSGIVFAGADMALIRHSWTFDEAFSTYVVQGLDKNGDGQYSREELADLARENVESLAEFAYFTFGTAGGKELEFQAPRDEWLAFDGKLLTLHFDLPMKAPTPLRQGIVEVYDPSYYVEFRFPDEKAVTLGSAPAGCNVLVKKPPAPDAAAQQKLAEADFMALDSEFSSQFANKAVIACP